MNSSNKKLTHHKTRLSVSKRLNANKEREILDFPYNSKSIEYCEGYIQAYLDNINFWSSINSLQCDLNSAILHYKIVSKNASDAGRALNYLGKTVKPKLRKRIEEIQEKIQLELPLFN